VAAGSIIHYLLIFDHQSECLLTEKPFTDADEAVLAYAAAEKEYQGQERMETVLVASDSIETIKLTHANYFAELPPVSRFLSDIAI